MSLDLMELLPGDWRERLDPLLDPIGTAALGAFVAGEYAGQTVYPPREDLFNAFRHCPFDSARVLILGQDPYHGPGQAHGLSFSVREGVRLPRRCATSTRSWRPISASPRRCPAT